MSFGARITTTTNQVFMPRLVDTVLRSNVLATEVLMKAERFRGERMKFPIKYQTNTTGTSFSGFDSLSTSATLNRVNLEFTPKTYQITSALPLDEITANATAGEAQILDLVDLTLKSDSQDMADGIGTIFYLDGTGNSSKDFNGLGNIVDDGTTAPTYGGLSRSTYPTLNSTVTASSGTLTLAKMATLFNAISDGSIEPNLGITTPTVWSLYEQLLQSQEQIMKTPVGGDASKFVGFTGMTGLKYKGFNILKDRKATSGVLFFLNMDFLNWYGAPVAMSRPIKVSDSKAKIVGNDYSNGDPAAMGFSWSDWIKPSNQAAVIAHTFLYGEFLSDNPRRHGKLTGITGV